MVYLSHLFVVLSAVVGTLANPTAIEDSSFVLTNLTKITTQARFDAWTIDENKSIAFCSSTNNRELPNG